ncbi:hypothetical protein D3C76_1636030 [compost metagenome]
MSTLAHRLPSTAYAIFQPSDLRWPQTGTSARKVDAVNAKPTELVPAMAKVENSLLVTHKEFMAMLLII